jgi:flagellin
MTISNANFNSDFWSAQINWIERQLNSTIHRIATGQRINNAGDDPTGVGIALHHSARISGIQSAVINAETALSALETADTALMEISDLLIEMRDLAVNAANDATLTAANRQTLNSAFESFRDLITSTAEAAKFNGISLLDGTFATPGKDSQVGPDSGGANIMSIIMPEITADTIAGGANTLTTVTLSSSADALDALSAVNDSIDYLNEVLSSIGFQEQRLNTIIDNLYAAQVNVIAAKSSIVDADLASEISRFASLQIIAQAATSTFGTFDAIKQRVIDIMDKIGASSFSNSNN